MFRISRALACAIVFFGAGCHHAGTISSGAGSLEKVESFLSEHADAIVLRASEKTAGTTSSVVVSPRLQGRIMTMSVGPLPSTGFVPMKTIMEGETHPHMNNFGGLDRFWIGPEAGAYGIYFPPDAEYTRETWQVPPAFDVGPFPVVSQNENQILLERDMEVQNYLKVRFNARVRRAVGIIEASTLPGEIGVDLPADVHYVGCYSANTMTNTGTTTWDRATGLIGIWILGMFNASPSCVVIAPFDRDAEGVLFNDEYFGKVSEETPERLKVVADAVVFRADAQRTGKFGFSQKRTLGIAGSFDFSSNLLTIVKFTVPEEPSDYGNSTWVKNQPNPYGGDAFQSYNHGDNAAPFYELESASPVKALAPGGSVSHRHATFQFQGSYKSMKDLAKTLLSVDLEAVKNAMFPDKK